ncbi:MAG: P-II family nitrogen regulator [Rhodobiaceae bacterium]|nr:P-II family nitrogen regulator [Rhodobiaceae bacterium]
MKMVMAVIQPHRLDVVREALNEQGISGLTVSEVRGYGRQKGHTEIYRGTEYAINYLPKVRLEIAVNDEDVDQTVAVIANSARTGRIGDGKIFVYDLTRAHRVRTGEEGPEAL